MERAGFALHHHIARFLPRGLLHWFAPARTAERVMQTKSEGGGARAAPGLLLRVTETIARGQDRLALFIVIAIIVCAGAVAGIMNSIPVAPAAICVALGVLAGAMLHAAQARKTAAQLRSAALQTLEQAEVDGLTRLTNRAAFMARLDDVLAPGQGAEVAVVFFDLDGFKGVNDTFGHEAGDALLAGVATRMRAVASQDEVVARLGGDEFATIVTGARAGERSATLSGDIIAALREPFDIGGKFVSVDASAGIAVSRGDLTKSELLRRADVAMYRTKVAGTGGWKHYATEMDQELTKRRAMQARLHEAIKRRELRLHYQPIISSATGRLAGAEALVRWPQADGGHLSPADFIPVAEDSGLILALGKWALEQALEQAREWRSVPIWINVSPMQVRNPGFVDMVGECLDASGVSPDLLTMEITESILMSHGDTAERSIDKLREMGVSLALDDFGRGLSSLGHLRRFSFDSVKIDRSFVWGADEHAGSTQLLKAVVDLAHGFGIDVVMEGVEDERQAGVVRLLGCDLMQGFHVGAPLNRVQFAQSYLMAGGMKERDPLYWIA